MITRKLKKKTVEKEPYQIWNSFIDIIACEAKENLNEIQRHAQRAFYYESEIQNGGHFQYFENMKSENFNEVIDSLVMIGAKEQAVILEKAVSIYFGKKRKEISNVNEFIAEALEGEFEEFDLAFHSCKKDMNYYLKSYLEKNINEFILIVE